MKFTLGLLPLAALVLAQEQQIPLATDPEERTFPVVPYLGFGTWNLKENCTEAVSWAIQAGYRHIDAAAIYGNEVEVGLGIVDGLAKTGLSRADLWVTSKLWNKDHAINEVEPALDETLGRLGLEYLDLYLMHWPVYEDILGRKSISYNDAWGAMTLLKAKRKVRHIGVANFSPEQLKDLMNHTKFAPEVHQMEMHPYLQQNDWLDFHKKANIHVTAYSPLAGTNPTYDGDDKPPKALLKNKVVKKIAKRRKCTPAQVVLSWGMYRDTSVIPKSSHLDRITENYNSIYCELSKKDRKKIDRLGKARYRFSNPSDNWGVDLFKGLEDSKGKHRKHS